MFNWKRFSRREFLKLASLLPVAWAADRLTGLAAGQTASDRPPNLIVIVFDAWSAHDVSLYGFPRQTMPNLARFAENAIVYHNHYSGGTFTVPGTASLLTGLYPWSHRAFQVGGGIINSHLDHQFFAALKSTRTTLAYSQNPLADVLISQAEQDIQTHLRSGSFDIDDNHIYSLPIFKNDRQVAFISLKNIFDEGQGIDGSAYLGPLLRLWNLRRELKDGAANDQLYPRGLPSTTDTELFALKDAVDGAIKALGQIQSPTMAYMHFFPPHKPYKPTKDFARAFDDNWKPVPKPVHPLSSRLQQGNALINRQWYDQYLASWDAEAGRLLDFMRTSGLASNSYIFITADHGEMFERGEIGHFTRLMFDPVMHIPLIVSTPGQQGRQDIRSYTSNVDILPTIASLAGMARPGWAEGALLPGLGGVDDPNRSVFVMDAKSNPSFAPMDSASFSITRNNGFRLAYYRYLPLERFELYNLAEDPEELMNLYPTARQVADDMKMELMEKIADADRLYKT